MRKSRKKRKIKFEVITVLPQALSSYFKESVVGRALENGVAEVKFHDLRDFFLDERKTVDDKPFGGGAGMVIKIEPVAKAIASILSKKSQVSKVHEAGKQRVLEIPEYNKKKTRVVLFSTRGKIFNSKEARRLSQYDQLVLICGRYEGVDERVAEVLADEEISVGDFILTGGELPAALVIDAVLRFVPGVLGKKESLEEVKGSYPVYTRPETVEFAGLREEKKKKISVPKVLLSGNHKEIEEWRRRSCKVISEKLKDEK